MDRKERRRRARERKKLQERLEKEVSRSNKTGQESPSRQESPTRQESPNRLKRVLKALGKREVVWKLFIGAIGLGLALLGGYSVARPHVSLEPYIPLNPVNPYSTQFTVKNESSMFDVYSMDCVCWPRIMNSGNNFSIVSPGILPNVHHTIPLLKPGGSSTVDCPPVIGGIGTYSGQVNYAELEIVISYKQSWWPFGQNERYPFAAMTDTQKAVHWVHITPDQERPILPQR